MLAQTSRQAQSTPDQPLEEIIDPTIAGRLRAAGIATAAEWLRLSRSQQNAFFGVTRTMVAAINAATKAQRQ
jgi:hypothetical protein